MKESMARTNIVRLENWLSTVMCSEKKDWDGILLRSESISLFMRRAEIDCGESCDRKWKILCSTFARYLTFHYPGLGQ